MPVFDLESKTSTAIKWAVSYAISNFEDWSMDDDDMTEEEEELFYLELIKAEEILAHATEITISSEKEEG